jgi:hypothetical protein
VEYVTVLATKALIPVPVIDMLFVCGEAKSKEMWKNILTRKF